jgi:hypothetical protein
LSIDERSQATDWSLDARALDVPAAGQSAASIASRRFHALRRA